MLIKLAAKHHINFTNSRTRPMHPVVRNNIISEPYHMMYGGFQELSPSWIIAFDTHVLLFLS